MYSTAWFCRTDTRLSANLDTDGCTWDRRRDASHSACTPPSAFGLRGRLYACLFVRCLLAFAIVVKGADTHDSPRHAKGSRSFGLLYFYRGFQEKNEQSRTKRQIQGENRHAGGGGGSSHYSTTLRARGITHPPAVKLPPPPSEFFLDSSPPPPKPRLGLTSEGESGVPLGRVVSGDHHSGPRAPCTRSGSSSATGGFLASRRRRRCRRWFL